MKELIPLSDVYYKKQYWNEHPKICEIINKRATGNSNVDWMAHFKKFSGKKFKRALILNCGNGWVERDLFKIHDLFESCVGLDVMKDFIEEAKSKAPSKDFTYMLHDINNDRIPDGPFDLIVNHAAAHHIAKLDKTFFEISSKLTNDGYFVNFDFVGPHRNQYPYEIWSRMVESNSKLPKKYQKKLQYPHLPTMLVTDPTEAIHSELIIETFERYYDLAFFRPVGGMLLYEILFQNENLLSLNGEQFLETLKEMINEEEKMLSINPQSTFFAYFVGRKKNFNEISAKKWIEEEEKRENLAKSNFGHYYTLTALQLMTQEFADQKDLCNTLQKDLEHYKSKPFLSPKEISVKQVLRLMVMVLIDRLKKFIKI